jgi:hypothetical protein
MQSSLGKTDRERLKAQRDRYRMNPKRFIVAVIKWRNNHREKFRAYQRAWKRKTESAWPRAIGTAARLITAPIDSH